MTKLKVQAVLAAVLVTGVLLGAVLRIPVEYFTALVSLAGTATGYFFTSLERETNKQKGRKRARPPEEPAG